MSKKKEPKDIVKLCSKCMEFVVVVMDERYGRCPRCETKLYDKKAGGIGFKGKMYFKRIQPKR